MHAVRIGEGVIVTAPGETFTEIGMAVKERAPGAPTVFCGYTNGMLGYFPIASEYPFGGYEPVLGTRGAGLGSMLDASCDRLLVENGVRLAERLFPEREPYDGDIGWDATGALPELPAQVHEHPQEPGQPGDVPGRPLEVAGSPVRANV
jgi:hypothetical protein